MDALHLLFCALSLISPLNKLLTGYQLAASPCQACSASHSHIVDAATVGAVVSWWWLCSMPKTRASNSFRTGEYFLSASVGALLANVTGWAGCISSKPSPSLDASP